MAALIAFFASPVLAATLSCSPSSGPASTTIVCDVAATPGDGAALDFSNNCAGFGTEGVQCTTDGSGNCSFNVAASALPGDPQDMTVWMNGETVCSNSQSFDTTADPVCGDGTIEGDEQCDDSDTDNGDGCSDACEIEAGWSCVGEPSSCTEDETCGDGAITGAEACDDGNALTSDGCDASCQLEPGWSCEGEPSVCTQPVIAADAGALSAGANTLALWLLVFAVSACLVYRFGVI